VDPRADDRSSFGDDPQRGRHQGADRREDQRGVERLRWCGIRAARPDRAEPARKRRGRRVAGTGEGVDRAPLVERHLRDDVSGGAEPVEADPLGVPGRPQRAVADEAGTEERRRLLVGVLGRQREAEAVIGHGEFGESAIQLIAGEAGRSQRFSRPSDRTGRRRRSSRARGRRPIADGKPIDSTSLLDDDPTIWCPGTSAGLGSGSSPSTMWRSVRQTAQALTRMRS